MKNGLIEEEKVSGQVFLNKPKPIDKDEDQAELDMSQPEKYYKKFDFFYKRTCFRLMAEFYKLTFQPFQK